MSESNTNKAAIKLLNALTELVEKITEVLDAVLEERKDD